MGRAWHLLQFRDSRGYGIPQATGAERHRPVVANIGKVEHRRAMCGRVAVPNQTAEGGVH